MFCNLVLNQKLGRGETVSLPSGAGISTRVCILPVIISRDQSDHTIVHVGCISLSGVHRSLRY
jgi:hypothetical protein